MTNWEKEFRFLMAKVIGWRNIEVDQELEEFILNQIKLAERRGYEKGLSIHGVQNIAFEMAEELKRPSKAPIAIDPTEPIKTLWQRIKEFIKRIYKKMVR